MSEKLAPPQPENKMTDEEVAAKFGDIESNFDNDATDHPLGDNETNIDTPKYNGEEGALFDESGVLNPDAIAEETSAKPEKTTKPLSEYTADELRAALIDAEKREGKESPYELGQEVIIRRHAYTANGERDHTKLGDLESGWKIENINEDGTYLLGKENGRLHDGREGHVKRDGVTALELQEWQNAFDEIEKAEPEITVESAPAEYDTMVGRAGNRISNALGERIDKWERIGGVKGIMRKLGRLAYRKSGLKASVNGVKRGAEAVGNGVDRTVLAVDRAKTATGNKISDTRESLKEKREALKKRSDEAKKRREIRARAYRVRKEQRKQDRTRREQERREKEVMDYVESQKSGKHRKERNMGRVGVRSPFYMKESRK